jgi:hypothetical protein
MTLGQLLQRLGDEAFTAEALVVLGDLPLMVEVEAAARRFGESASFYVAAAARRFESHASEEDWLALMGALGRTGDPGMACLRQMLAWSLRHDTDDESGDAGTCGCGHGTDCERS